MHSKDKISQVIMLISRHYIYSTKCAGYVLNLYSLIDHIIYYKNIEKYIEICNNVERSFYSKWIRFRLFILYSMHIVMLEQLYIHHCFCSQ